MPNIENIQKVIEKLRDEDTEDHFNLNHFFAVIEWGDVMEVSLSQFLRHDGYNDCETVACIAGWALIVKSEQEDSNIGFPSSWKDVFHTQSQFTEMACEFLGIEVEVGQKLFFAKPGSYWHQWADVLGLNLDDLDYGDWDQIRTKHAIILLEKLIDNELERELVS